MPALTVGHGARFTPGDWGPALIYVQMSWWRVGKRVPKTKRTENAGLIAVAQFANNLGWAWRPTPNDDYGLDGELEPVEDAEPTGKIIKVQVKSGTSYRKGETEIGFYFLASQNDLEYWSNVNTPVLLVVHDLDNGATYAVDVHEALQQDPSIRRSRRIPFDKRNDVLSEASEAKLLAAAKGEGCTGRIFRRPGGKFSENLHSNLLPLRSMPRVIYGAPTSCRTQADIRTALGEQRKTPAIPSDGMLWTFADLGDDECSLRTVCDTAQLTHVERFEWQSDPVRSRLLVQLMNTCLRKKLTANGLIYDRDKNRYYFRPDDGGDRRLTWQSLKNRVTKPVVYPHVGGSGEVDYWVHWAARFQFLFFGRRGYLMIEPAMVFTRDGTALVGGEEMGRLATSRVSHQYNRNVLGLLFFWREFLRAGEKEIAIFGAPLPKRLSADCNFLGGSADFGIFGDSIAVTELGEDLDEVDLALSEQPDRELADEIEVHYEDEHGDEG